MSLYIVRFEGDHEVEADNPVEAGNTIRRITSGVAHISITETVKVAD